MFLFKLIFVFSLIQYKPLAFKDYQYPEWGINFGWLLALSSMLSIPVYAVYKFLSTSGTFKEVRIPKFRQNSKAFGFCLPCRDGNSLFATSSMLMSW